MRKFFCIFLILALIPVFCIPVFAEGYSKAPYNSYNYDEWETADSAPAGYIPVKSYYGDANSNALITDPSDMFIDRKIVQTY